MCLFMCSLKLDSCGMMKEIIDSFFLALRALPKFTEHMLLPLYGENKSVLPTITYFVVRQLLLFTFIYMY